MNLLTIGYEGLTPDTFFAALNTQKVQSLIDVRELPLSRKPGFSKTALSQTAASHTIAYMHIVELGCPKDIRHTYRQDRDWQRYQRRYLEHLEQQQPTLEALVDQMQYAQCCLVCFEADYTTCHRSLIARRLKSLVGESLTVTHLRSRAPSQVATPGCLVAPVGRTAR